MSLGTLRLQDRDRPDFERALQQAMSTERVRTALASGRTAAEAEAGAARLRAMAWESADGIVAVVGEEYAAYARARSRPGGRRRSVLPALAVLAPAVAGCAAVILLLLGTVLGVAGAGLAGPLTTAGWVCAVFAGAAGAAGLVVLFVTSARNRPRVRPAVEAARDAWRTALLERALLPFLTTALDGTGSSD